MKAKDKKLCPKCFGLGTLNTEDVQVCPVCQGSGWVNDEKEKEEE